MINTQIVKPYSINDTITYRYLDDNFVNDFFIKGIIRLSCFCKFREYDDEIRGDIGEGKTMYVGNDKENDRSFGVFTSSGNNALVLCTSLLLNKTLMNEDNFNTNSVFKINDTLGFGVSIANRLSNFKAGLEGHCQYVERRIVMKEMKNIDIEDFQSDEEPEKTDLNKIMKKTNQVSDNSRFFLKLHKHSNQFEYRHLWFLHEDVKEHQSIICPEAREFCERVELDEIPEI